MTEHRLECKDCGTTSVLADGREAVDVAKGHVEGRDCMHVSIDVLDDAAEDETTTPDEDTDEY